MFDFYICGLHFPFQSKELCILAVFVQTEEKKAKGVIATAMNYQMGAYGEDGATLYLELCSEGMREDRSFRKGNSNYLQGGEKTSQWGFWDIGAGCLEGLLKLHPWGYSKLDWTRLWANLTWLQAWPCFEWGVGPDDLQKSCQLKLFHDFMTLHILIRYLSVRHKKLDRYVQTLLDS